MKILRALLLCLIVLNSCQQENTAANLFGKNVKCWFVEKPSGNASCGINSVTVAMKFKMESENGGKEKYIIGVISCPEMYGEDFFNVKSVYNLHLMDTAGKKSDILINPYVDRKLPFYYVDSLAKVKVE